MNTRSFHTGLRTLAALVSLGAACASQAITFNVLTDTSALLSEPGPFALDFQLTDGSGIGDGNNTVTVSNFDFHGGGWVGPDPGPITLTDNAFWTDFFQEFTPGAALSFDVSMTNAIDPGATPDQSSFAVLFTSSLIEIPTLGPADALLTIDFDQASPTVRTFGTDPNRTTIDIAAPTVVVATVPDSGVSSLAVLLLWTGLCARRHFHPHTARV